VGSSSPERVPRSERAILPPRKNQPARIRSGCISLNRIIYVRSKAGCPNRATQNSCITFKAVIARKYKPAEFLDRLIDEGEKIFALGTLSLPRRDNRAPQGSRRKETLMPGDARQVVSLVSRSVAANLPRDLPLTLSGRRFVARHAADSTWSASLGSHVTSRMHVADTFACMIVRVRRLRTPNPSRSRATTAAVGFRVRRIPCLPPPSALAPKRAPRFYFQSRLRLQTLRSPPPSPLSLFLAVVLFVARLPPLPPPMIRSSHPSIRVLEFIRGEIRGRMEPRESRFIRLRGYVRLEIEVHRGLPHRRR